MQEEEDSSEVRLIHGVSLGTSSFQEVSIKSGPHRFAFSSDLEADLSGAAGGCRQTGLTDSRVHQLFNSKTLRQNGRSQSQYQVASGQVERQLLHPFLPSPAADYATGPTQQTILQPVRASDSRDGHLERHHALDWQSTVHLCNSTGDVGQLGDALNPKK